VGRADARQKPAASTGMLDLTIRQFRASIGHELCEIINVG
jgi:hypothetical protein